MILLLFLSAVIVLIIWLFTDYTLGKRHFRKTRKQRQYPVRHGDFTVFTCGENLFPHYFSDILHAKKSIYVLFYIVKNDEISREFFSLLAKKAREGKEVKVLLDWAGSRKVTKQMIAQLKNAAVSFAFSNRPKFPFFFYTLQQRNHRKITVIDGKTGYLGGFNVGKDYINGNKSLSPWRDYHFRLTGGSIRDLQEEFIRNWETATGENMPFETHISPHEEKSGCRHRIIPTAGDELEHLVCSLIDEARESVFIGSPYFIPTPAIHKKLVQALARGVKVTVLTPDRADHPLVKEAASRYFRQLLENGADIYLFKPGFYHAKIMIIDRTVCNIGTANFDRRSARLNFEVNCLVYDNVFIQKMCAVVKDDMRHAAPLTSDGLNRPGLATRLAEWGVRAIEGFL